MLIVTELRLPVVLNYTRSQDFIPPTDPEHKFHKMGIDNWLPIGFNLGLS